MQGNISEVQETELQLALNKFPDIAACLRDNGHGGAQLLDANL